MYRTPGVPKDSFSWCLLEGKYWNNFFIFKFRTALRAHCAPEGYANRKIDLDTQSTREYEGYPISTTGYDILKRKNIILDPVKDKISKNQKLLFYATDGDLLELKKLLQRKFKIVV